ncbi:MAG: hypothetical protein ABI611_09120 [Solirubrobacteraceae bacterium]
MIEGADVRTLLDGNGHARVSQEGHRHQHDDPVADEHGHDAHGHDEHEHEQHEHGHDEHEHGQHAQEQDAHDHHAMMEVTGEPSADGLVMEDLEFELGPLSAVLPGGVMATLTLDGDVVESCGLRATLVSADLRVPDPLACAAWSAIQRDTEASMGRVFDVELERAVSHAAWLTRLGRVLGWAELADGARRILGHALSAREGHHEALRESLRAAERLHGRLECSRRLRFRLRGRAVVDRGTVEAYGLTGPAARAAGVAFDARVDDPAYGALGFAPALRAAGDAEARTLVRLEEIAVSLGLALRGLDHGADAPAAPAIEGPRGPLRHNAVSGGLEASGAAALLRVAGERAAGLEWSDAIAAITSFDLSGWRVAG